MGWRPGTARGQFTFPYSGARPVRPAPARRSLLGGASGFERLPVDLRADRDEGVGKHAADTALFVLVITRGLEMTRGHFGHSELFVHHVGSVFQVVPVKHCDSLLGT